MMSPYIKLHNNIIGIKVNVKIANNALLTLYFSDSFFNIRYNANIESTFAKILAKYSHT